MLIEYQAIIFARLSPTACLMQDGAVGNISGIQAEISSCMKPVFQACEGEMHKGE